MAYLTCCAAQQGLSLKQNRVASSLTCLLLPNRFRQILKKIVDTKEGMGKKMRDSSFALTEAKYAAGEFRHTVFDSVETVRTSAQSHNVVPSY